MPTSSSGAAIATRRGTGNRSNDGSIEYCHKQSKAHYRFVLAESDLLGPNKEYKNNQNPE
jgi:hypothetical protein